MTTRSYIVAAALAALAAIVAGCGAGQREQETAGTVPLNVNLVENPSFETWNGSVPAGWNIEQYEGEGERSMLYGRSSDEKRSGSYSFYLRGVYNTEKWMMLTQRHPVLPGHRLRYGVEIQTKDLKKNRGQGDFANLFVRFYKKNGERVSEDDGSTDGTRDSDS